MSLIGRSRVAALKRDGAGAVANARAAMDLLGSTHAGGQGAAVWAFARGLALQGEVDSSIDAYHRAVDLLSVHGQRHDAGLAAVELAALLRNEGRADEADTILRRAYDLGVDAETASARPR
jgi:tetratricopeptide (TPR) repeat protein